MADTFWGCVNVVINTIPSLLLTYIPFRNKVKVKTTQAFAFNALAYVLFIAVYIFLAPSHLSFDFLQAYKLVFIVPGVLIAFAIIEGNKFKICYFILMMITYIVVSAKLANFFAFRIYENPGYFALGIANVCVFAVTLPLMIIYQNRIFRLTDEAFEATDTNIWKVIWIVPLLFMLLCLSSNLKFDPAMIREPQFIIMNLLTVAGMTTSTSVLIKTLKQASENVALKENARITAQQLTLQGEQYEMLAEHIAEAKAARHDMRHHLSALQAYIDSGDKAALSAYLTDYRAALPEDSEAPLCKNFTVNAVVRHYINWAKTEGIAVSIRLEIPKNTEVSDTDLCIILGNLIENAVEACGRTQTGEKFIKINSKLFEKLLTITVDNSFDGEVKKDGDVFLSSKREGAGIGLSSVRAVAAKYGGMTKFEIQENVFMASVYVKVG